MHAECAVEALPTEAPACGAKSHLRLPATHCVCVQSVSLSAKPKSTHTSWEQSRADTSPAARKGRAYWYCVPLRAFSCLNGVFNSYLSSINTHLAEVCIQLEIKLARNYASKYPAPICNYKPFITMLFKSLADVQIDESTQRLWLRLCWRWFICSPVKVSIVGWCTRYVWAWRKRPNNWSPWSMVCCTGNERWQAHNANRANKVNSANEGSRVCSGGSSLACGSFLHSVGHTTASHYLPMEFKDWAQEARVESDPRKSVTTGINWNFREWRACSSGTNPLWGSQVVPISADERDILILQSSRCT